MTAATFGQRSSVQRRESWWTFWQRELSLDCITSFLLLLGIVCVTQGSLLVALHEQGVIENLSWRSTLRVTMAPDASEAQVQMFLQAVLGMPQVLEARYTTRAQQYDHERKRDPATIAYFESVLTTNPFQDIVDVTLRSREDISTFLTTFLEQPELSLVLDERTIPSVLDQVDAQASKLLWHRSAQLFLFAFSGSLIFLIFLSALQISRVNIRKRKAELLVGYLSGASPWFLRKGVFVETLSLLFTALAFASLIILGICALPSVPVLGEIHYEILRQWGFWMLLLEVLFLAGIGYFSAILIVQNVTLGKMLRRL